MVSIFQQLTTTAKGNITEKEKAFTWNNVTKIISTIHHEQELRSKPDYDVSMEWKALETPQLNAKHLVYVTGRTNPSASSLCYVISKDTHKTSEQATAPERGKTSTALQTAAWKLNLTNRQLKCERPMTHCSKTASKDRKGGSLCFLSTSSPRKVLLPEELRQLESQGLPAACMAGAQRQWWGAGW